MGTVYHNNFCAPERLLLWHEVMATLSNGGHNKVRPANMYRTSACESKTYSPKPANKKGPCICEVKQQPKRQHDKNGKHVKEKTDSKMSKDGVVLNINVYDWSKIVNKM